MWIDQLCLVARTHGASDLYLLENAIPQVRIRGEWAPLGDQPLAPEEMERFWSGCGGGKETQDHDGSFISSDDGRFRVNLFRSLGRRGAVLRQIKMLMPVLRELGVPAFLLEPWLARPSGLILVTGRTGSGKSTTLAGCLEWMNQHHIRHVITIEDPIEFLFSPNQCLFSQREVGVDTPSFGEGLRRALRQSPDVIMVGEIRDADSARTVLQACETGHLVLASMHSQSVPETFERLVQLFPVEEREAVMHLLATQLLGIVSQLLLAGANGRLVLACEYLQNNALPRKWIKEGKFRDLADLIAKGDRREMNSFLSALVDLHRQGTITEEQAMAVASNPQEFQRMMRGISGGGVKR